jgi:hypothetical protein
MPYIRKRTHRETVAKIVKEEDVLEHVKNLRARFYGGLEEALQSTFDYIRNSKDGGKLAYEMLKDAAVIPNNCQKVDLELQAKQPDPESEQAAIKKNCCGLSRRGYRAASIFRHSAARS